MTAVYNEIEPFAVRWLRNLIAAGHVAPGVVDERSIADLSPADVAGPGQRHFFAGIAGWSLALRLAGVPDDADVWTGSCPCQPFSAAGRRGGTGDDRHLWPTWFELIRECRPAVVFGEQVASRDGLGWLDLVFTDLEGEGYACAAADLPAAGVGAPHKRQRLFFVAYAAESGLQKWSGPPSPAERPKPNNGSRTPIALGDSDGESGRRDGRAIPREETEAGGALRGSTDRLGIAGRHVGWSTCDWIYCSDGFTRPTQPGVRPLAHGLPGRVGQLRAYGNAIVPQVAAQFIRAALEAA